MPPPPPSSSHPRHEFKSIPFGVALRLRRNCSEDDFLSNRCKEYKGYLVNQGYPVNLVDNQFLKALTIPRKDLLKQKFRASKKIFPFVTTFNPMLPDLNYIIKKHLHFLASNPRLRELFPKNSIISSYRRSKNLKKILAPSKFESTHSQRISSPAGSCFKCDKNKCDLCKNYFVESRNFSSFKTGKSYSIRPNLTCDSKNVIFLVSCKKCQLQYIGSRTQFKVRFSSTSHSLQDFPFQCIDQFSHDCTQVDKFLITKEAYCSAQLFTLSPYGLNKRQEFHSKNRIHFNSLDD